MRKPFLLSLLVALLTTLSTHAFKSGDLYYNITSENTVEVTYQEWDSESNYQGLTTATIPESVTYNGTTYSVTSIGGEAFYYCSSLTSITIPNSVTSIGEWAFSECSSLTSITIPNSVTSIGENAFTWCSSLTSVIWNAKNCEGRYYDEYGPFYGICANITSFTFGEEVETIPSCLCYRMSSLTSITLPNSVTSIENYAFAYCSSLTSITIPNSVTSIGSSAFDGCSSLTSVVWNAKNCAGWEYLNDAPFYEIRANITSFTFGEEIETIPSGLCYGMTSLTSITIPNSVTSIEDGGTFRGCSSLTSITIGNSVTSIGGGAFYECSSLTSITIGNSVTSIGMYAFAWCSSLTSITLPNSVTSIGNNAFDRCYALTSITIPNSVTTIGGGAFYEVPNIVYSGTATGSPWGARSVNGYVDGYFVYADDTKTNLLACSAAATGEITLPNSVTSIGYRAFNKCSSLTSVTIPNSVTSIGDDAFYGCSSLTSVTSLSCTPPLCGSDVFLNTASEKTLVVPSISMDAYKNSSTWKDFTSFEKCLSIFVQSSDSTLGVAQIAQDVDCDSVAIISAIANPGYQFTQWSDGNTDNPRTIKLTQDTTFIAEFEMDYSGKCGDDLYWAYSNQEIKITGSGSMYNYTDSTMPWTLLRDSIKTVRVGNNATSIGEYAFANTRKLAELQIGTGVEDISANAFAGCNRIYHIYCYPTYPPFADESSFANYNVYLHIPCENKEDYTLDLVWGKFKFIECIGSEDVEVSGNEVTVSPDYEDATFTWPVTDNADTYSLVITKDGVTLCTLVFNAQGQLVSIAFKPRRQNAPAAEGTTPATYAEMTANGFRFTVTGLEEGSAYAYTLTVRNAANTVLETYTGDFTTLSNTPTGINESAGEDAHGHGQVEKIIRNGQVLIIRNGETYDMMGQRL